MPAGKLSSQNLRLRGFKINYGESRISTGHI